MSELKREYAPRPSGHRVIEPEVAKPKKTTRRKAEPEAESEEE